jgi:glycosyltransferase involved in cell wall biosynthesis
MQATLPAQKIRVARVIGRLNVGGPAIHVAALAARLPADRFESRLFAGDVSPGEQEMADAVVREGVAPVKVPGLGRAIRITQDVDALGHLIAEFRRFKPHIVHTHAAKGGALGRVAARLAGVPVVVHTFHGHVFEGYFSRAATTAILDVERALALLSNAIVAISPRQRADLTERFRVAPPQKTHLVPLGFDWCNFDGLAAQRGALRAELQIGSAPIVSVVGRLTPIKDHPLLFHAFRDLSPPQAHLCVVGGGEREPQLRALAAELGIGARTHFLGFRKDVARILADTDVVALTSLNEGTPVALIEALAAGCSVVALNVGGVADVLEDGKWGYLVPSRAPSTLAASLGDAVGRHRSRSREAVAVAARYAREKYAVARLVRDHVELYERLLARRAIPQSRGYVGSTTRQRTKTASVSVSRIA